MLRAPAGEKLDQLVDEYKVSWTTVGEGVIQNGRNGGSCYGPLGCGG